MNGILYSPVVGLRSVSMSITPVVFIDEFHAMLAMNMNSMSIG